jgi:hypothetical protein
MHTDSRRVRACAALGCCCVLLRRGASTGGSSGRAARGTGPNPVRQWRLAGGPLRQRQPGWDDAGASMSQWLCARCSALILRARCSALILRARCSALIVCAHCRSALILRGLAGASVADGRLGVRRRDGGLDASRPRNAHPASSVGVFAERSGWIF